MNVLECSHLTKRYRGQTALQDVSLSLQEGKVYGIIGATGAGKTTLVRLIAGITKPDEGTLSLFNAQNEKEFQKARRDVGFLIDNPPFFGTLTANQTLKAVAYTRGIKNEDYEGLLRKVDLSTPLKTKLRDYSDEMKRFYGVASALMGSPKLLVLDEPAKGFSTRAIRSFRDHIKEILKERGCTALIFSQSLSSVYGLATDFVFLYQGQIIGQMDQKTLDARCPISFTLVTSNNEKAASVLGSFLEKVALCEDDIEIRSGEWDEKQITQMLSENQIQVQSLTKKGQTLDEYFDALTGGIADGKSV